VQDDGGGSLRIAEMWVNALTLAGQVRNYCTCAIFVFFNYEQMHSGSNSKSNSDLPGNLGNDQTSALVSLSFYHLGKALELKSESSTDCMTMNVLRYPEKLRTCLVLFAKPVSKRS
jgi:hypothetical protein